MECACKALKVKRKHLSTAMRRDIQTSKRLVANMDSFRAVLEVAKFLEPVEVLQNYEKVAVLFTRAANAEELWLSFINTANPNIGRINLSVESAKTYYLREFFKKLPELSCEALKIYYLPYRKPIIRLLSRPIRIDPGSIYLFLPDSRVFLCGGVLNLTYVIDSHSGSVSEAAPMLVQRSHPGLISVDGSVYAFGGLRDSTSLRRAEKWKSEWGDLPKMSFSHDSFAPCSLNASVFLFTSHGCEVFRVRTQVFSPLDLKLTIPADGAIAGIVRNELLLVSKNTVLRIAVLSTVRIVNSSRMKNLRLQRSFPAVSLQNNLYFLEDRGLYMANIDSLRVTAVGTNGSIS